MKHRFKQIYKRRWGICIVVRPAENLVVFSGGTVETCTFIHKPSDISIRMRTEVLEGGRTVFRNESLACDLDSLAEEEQYFYYSSANYILWTIEEEIENDMLKRLKGEPDLSDCSACYLDYKDINTIINTMQKHISQKVLKRYLYDIGMPLPLDHNISKN